MKKLVLILLTARAMFAVDPEHNFAFDLFQEVQSESKNWVFSPFSISACLSMVATGADGKTAEEMCTVLGLAKEEIGPHFEQKLTLLKHLACFPTDYQLNLAQGVWVKEDFSILPSFFSLLENSFQAIAERVPFTPFTAHKINEWIASETHQKIQNLIPPSVFTQATRLVLANALYFHGSWTYPFSSRLTTLRPFHLPSGETIDAPTMTQTASFPYFENERLQAVVLPMAHDRSSRAEPICLLVLPKESLTSNDLSEILSSLKTSRIQIQVPKFTIEQAIDLNQPLKNLGIRKAFCEAADFSKIDGAFDLYLSCVLHKSFFAFDEKGIEAAAATAAVIHMTSVLTQPTPTIPFILDRPFYFLLLDQPSQTILFLGQVQNPQA